jgi:hypothetical protein
VNSDWPRWFAASIAKHFVDQTDLVLISNENDIDRALIDDKLPIFIEGHYRRTRDYKRLCELRYDGPYLTETAKDQWIGNVAINVLLQVALPSDDLWTLQRMQGIIGAAFTTILIYKLGTGAADDGTILACMDIVQDAMSGQDLKIMNLGNVSETTDIQQSAIEAQYKVHLTT